MVGAVQTTCRIQIKSYQLVTVVKADRGKSSLVKTDGPGTLETVRFDLMREVVCTVPTMHQSTER